MSYAQLKPSVSWLSLSARPRRDAARRIGILLFDGFSLLGAGMIAEVFHTANALSEDASDQAAQTRYEVRFLSLTGGNIACSASVHVWTDEIDPGQPPGFDMLFVAAGEDAHGHRIDERVVGWLRAAAHRKTATVRPIAQGRAVLDAAGISLLSTLPDTQSASQPLAPDAADDQFESMKAALTLIRHEQGVDAARAVAGRVMPSWSSRLLPCIGDAGMTGPGEKIRAAARWLRQHCEQDISIADAAEVAAMSERNFLRRFKLETGITPSDFLLQSRLDTACRFLAETELPVDKVARRSGMGNGDRLAKIFRKRLSISPTEFRQRSRLTVDG
uniref:GlxA family transcriptional regulator n=1 Tax=Cupriavidus yeoncheonensis TaxID=1462994 RepID=UPI003F49589E